MNPFQEICSKYSGEEQMIRLQNYIWRSSNNMTIIVRLLEQLKLKDQEIERLKARVR